MYSDLPVNSLFPHGISSAWTFNENVACMVQILLLIYNCFIHTKSFFCRKCHINNVRDTYKAAVCIGRQPDSNVWIFGENLQINDEGRIVNETSYVFIKHLFEPEDAAPQGQGTTRSCNSFLPSIEIPLSSLTLGDVVRSLRDTLHHNVMAGIFTIGTSCARMILT